jgi:hypothetical protein
VNEQRFHEVTPSIKTHAGIKITAYKTGRQDQLTRLSMRLWSGQSFAIGSAIVDLE